VLAIRELITVKVPTLKTSAYHAEQGCPSCKTLHRGNSIKTFVLCNLGGRQCDNGMLQLEFNFHVMQIGHSTDVSKIGTFARYLREMFRADNDAATLRLAAETLGRLVAAGGALTADVVEQEVTCTSQQLCGKIG
jgi:hypothetical protein